MHFEAHAALGWAISNLGGADRALRKWCVIGALLPDLDAIPYLFGPQAYGQWHHTFGHNVFLWALFMAGITFKFRSIRALVLSFLCFGSHLLTDAQFSGWNLQLFWPISNVGYLFPAAVSLSAPINTQMVYGSFLLVAALGVAYKRTPIELLSPKLDALLLSAFSHKPHFCAVCRGPSNQICSRCGDPICIRHTTVKRNMVLLCPDCVHRHSLNSQPEKALSSCGSRDHQELDRAISRHGG